MDDSDSSILSDLSSSDLSSIESQSPSLGYPSPISSQDQDSLSNGESQSEKKRKNEEGGTPSKKKRKRPEPKPRSTMKLDLTTDPQSFATEQKEQLELLLKVLRKRRKIVVIAGAGISVSAGIPDFRSSTGLFKSLKSDHKLKASGKQLFDASVYQTDSSTSSFHDMVRNLSTLVSAAPPTEFHKMLSTLGSEGRLMRLYTQNVDGIDVAQPALQTSVPLGQKGPWPRTVQLHGGLEKMVCSKCRALSDFKAELFNGPEPPCCENCIEADRVRTDHAGKRSHGIGRLRPRIVLYNEHNPDEEAIGCVVSADLRSRPDAVIVVGTSMKIPGVRRIVREMCGVVRGRRDGLAVWINQDGPPPGKEFEDCWDLIVKGPCDEVARQLELSVNPHIECTSSDVERAKNMGTVSVMVNASSSGPAMITPAASPYSGQKPKTFIKLHMGPKDITTNLKKPKSHVKSKPKSSRNQSSTNGNIKKNPTQDRINQRFKATKPISKSKKTTVKVDTLSDVQSTEFIHAQTFPNSTLSQSRPTDSMTVTANQRVLARQDDPTTPLKIETPHYTAAERRCTPGSESRSASSPREGTISPTSIPRGMAHLLDT